jgi:hypothetical protein
LETGLRNIAEQEETKSKGKEDIRMKDSDDFQSIKLLVEEVVLQALGVTENLPAILSKHRISQRK